MKHEESPEDEPLPLPILPKTLGKVVIQLLDEFEHDPFIDSLDKSIKYPEDAP